MKPIVFFTDAGKDGDDLLATIHSILQAKSAGIIPMDTPIHLVTTDEIPCDDKGIQHPEGQYGLRALYLTMQLAKLQQQLKLPPEAYPTILVGPQTTYYSFDQEKQKFYHQETDSFAFYPGEEIEQYYSKSDIDRSGCGLKDSSVWVEKLQHATPDGATLVSIAGFDAVSDFIAAIPSEQQQNFSLTTMGYNKPYSDADYELRTASKHFPYNARITDPHKASEAIINILKLNGFHVVSETTRTLPKYDQNNWLASFSEIMARAYPLHTGQYSESLLSAMVAFLKHSKYHGFWPHDVVSTLAVLLEHGQWEKLELPKLKKEMLFTSVENALAQQLSFRMVGTTGVVIDSTVATEENDIKLGTEGQFFTYGKELDPIFFTSLLHFLAIEALPVENKKAFTSLQASYKTILQLKARLFELKQTADSEPAVLQALEQEIKALWTLTSLKELQNQLALMMEDELLSEDIQYILGTENTGFSIAKFTTQQAKGFHHFISTLITWGEQLNDKSMLSEELLKWIKELAESLQKMKFELTEPMVANLQKALLQVSPEKKFSPLTTALMNELRLMSLYTDRVRELLKERGTLGIEFKRTGNSMLYAIAALSGHLTIPFPRGIYGMTEQYKALLSLRDQKPSYRQAFLFHLAIHDAGKGDVIKNHDAGKGDVIKNAVRMNEKGNYFIAIEDKYYQLEPNALQEVHREDFLAATEHVDHDTALEVYATAGARLKQCSLTEFLIWGGPSTEVNDKETFAVCDELISLCNETNIAQIVQGEIPFIGVKKGLDLFFEAYAQDSEKAKLIFIHHCYDIFGAAPLDSFASITGGFSPEIHIKINLLYETLLEVAQEQLGEKASSEAYHRYRQKLAKAIPEIAVLENSQETVILAKTRVAQMLRCHLFKTETNAQTKQQTISENGVYDEHTRLFVRSIEKAVNKLPQPLQDELIEFLNRNTYQVGKPAVMVMYGPKLLLTGTTGAEFAPVDPTDEQVLVDCLIPMLSLYHDLYDFQANRLQASSTSYGVIDVNDLALIVQRVFPWYQKAAFAEKNTFASLLFTLQTKGLAKEFLAKLGDPKLLQSESQQLAKLTEVISTFDVPFEVTEAGLRVKVSPSLSKESPLTPATKSPDPKVEEVPSEPKLSTLRESEVKMPTIDKISGILAAIDEGQTKFRKQEILLEEVNKRQFSVEEFNSLYMKIKNIEALNEHRNPRLDSFFGLKNTTSWRKTLSIFRGLALKALEAEVNCCDNADKQLDMLETAKKLPLFCEHRNNSVFSGAWGRTASVRTIDEAIKEIEEKSSLSLS
ncbi:hypothetical protein [Legionella jamestowniensis]|uniref:Uncharacterized protein n=1 Tax=Legionella jamestowniensis TaxID=455 RepID=A0A0W0UZP9_9GAMM|nr:hypothetical protein [Legionella jamestowniensis]KTD13345.1 hypothetical protein Ljam_0135 [Legionella jamestowniensis]SFL76739.1 hypothetical protein SAMN02746073_1793 [Legionella jamestowniensis DSM 19215]